MFDLLAGLLNFYYSLVHSYIAAISMLTLTVMLLLAPLTVKSTRSMLALQRLQPEIKKLQAAHKGDRQALNEAMMAFYKEHKINPLGGCLPMLLQMPVFIIMYQVIRGLVQPTGPKYLDPEHSELARAILRDSADVGKKGGRMIELGIDLAKSASNIGGGIGKAWPYYLMVGLVVATGYIQARQMSSRQSPQAAQANQQAQMIQKIFPIIFGVISLSIPAGVVVYFIVSNLFRITQQGLMYKYDPQLKATVAKEVKEVEAKAVELKKQPKAKPKDTPAPAVGQGGSGNGQGPRPSSRTGGGGGPNQRNRSRSKKRRKGR
ncbi:MAG: YidC/Oxa1 family rane protein insertase [Actinomycetota bacterium]|jgi:YidC/Oxa1 family membrane protein insertase